eukprot:2903167-Rhodomonas_salina.2
MGGGFLPLSLSLSLAVDIRATDTDTHTHTHTATTSRVCSDRGAVRSAYAIAMSCPVLTRPMVLPGGAVQVGTDVLHGRPDCKAIMLYARYAESGTDVAYAATR